MNESPHHLVNRRAPAGLHIGCRARTRAAQAACHDDHRDSDSATHRDRYGDGHLYADRRYTDITRHARRIAHADKHGDVDRNAHPIPHRHTPASQHRNAQADEYTSAADNRRGADVDADDLLYTARYARAACLLQNMQGGKSLRRYLHRTQQNVPCRAWLCL